MYFFKPVVWNSNGYVRPGGGNFVVGYPAEHGFGHEEWNNSPRYRYAKAGEDFRVFHTEGLGKQKLDAAAGRIVVFLIAAHGSQQYLVAVAAGCTSLHGPQHKRQRLQLVEQLGLSSLAEDAWSLSQVRERYDQDRPRFEREWKKDLHFLPNWTCPDSLYLPMSAPVPLNPKGLTGKSQLVRRYGSYQTADQALAVRVLNIIGQINRSPKLEIIQSFCGNDGSDVREDWDAIEHQHLNVTTAAALYQARIGQGKFRSDLLQRWNGACAVTGCNVGAMLRASHIRPWRDSDNRQRLDSHNGLLLAAHLDCLFDKGLIAFGDDGEMLVSPQIEGRVPAELGIGGRLTQRPSERMKAYLRHHREFVFKR